jgi:ribitol-5-phosphate 2-dehydrogenase
MIPLAPAREPAYVKENYREDSRFLSSDADGFMRDVVSLPHELIIAIEHGYSIIYAFSEVISVALNALEAFERSSATGGTVFGVWGDGSMGYVMGLVLKCVYPQGRVYIFGKTMRKLQRFSFADKVFCIDDAPSDLRVDHCFECVGDRGGEAAIAQMTAVITPQGCVNLLGVSEEPVAVNTRILLEKGLRLIGNSRSGFADFDRAVALIRENEMCERYLRMLISDTIEIKTEEDIAHAFEQDSLNDFKTVLKWRI